MVKLGTLFNMATASSQFKTRKQLTVLGAKAEENCFILNSERYVPLYEGKMIWFYNHHYGEFPIEDVQRPNSIPSTPYEVLSNPNSALRPWYWVKESDVQNRLVKADASGNIVWEWKHSYYIGFRDVTNATNERTCVASLMPSTSGAGDKAPLVFTSRGLIPSCELLAMMSSLTFDFVARQKVGGSSMGFFMMKQLPFLTPEQIQESGYEQDIVERVARLCWFNHDLDGWMNELREDCPNEYDLPEEPTIWDEEQRAIWQAELDAIFAHLYGLSTEDLRYILDPEDVCGKGCINETFRVLKDREIREYGEYRTKRLVMEAWNFFGFNN
jgi:hypothetical protein